MNYAAVDAGGQNVVKLKFLPNGQNSLLKMKLLILYAQNSSLKLLTLLMLKMVEAFQFQHSTDTKMAHSFLNIGLRKTRYRHNHSRMKPTTVSSVTNVLMCVLTLLSVLLIDRRRAAAA